MASKPPFDCTSCHFFIPMDPLRPQTGGSCHQHPPVPYLVPGPGGRPNTICCYPTVGRGDWCGSHQLFALMGHGKAFDASALRNSAANLATPAATEGALSGDKTVRLPGNGEATDVEVVNSSSGDEAAQPGEGSEPASAPSKTTVQ
jgi:hypothetical protein